MTKHAVRILLDDLRAVLKQHGIADAVLVLHKGDDSLTWVFPGCPAECEEPDMCAAKSMELTAAFLEDRVDELLDRDTSQTRGVNLNGITKH